MKIWRCYGVFAMLCGLMGCVYHPVMTPVTKAASWSELTALTIPPADRVIRYGNAPGQIIDVRLPRSNGRHPVAILLHGGCWQNSFDRGYFGHLAEALRNEGWATFNVEYRRLGDPGGGWPGTFDDVAAATAFVLAHGVEWQLELNHVVVVGHSAGGHLALLLANREPRISAVVGLAAITDLAAYQKESIDCAESARLLVTDLELPRADPMQQPVPMHTKILLWNGSADRIVPAAYATRYAARSSSITATVWPGAGHFDLVSPKSSVWPEIIRQFSRLR